MSATHLSLHYHLVFGTKGRLPLIDPNWQPRLHAMLGGGVRHLGGTAQAVGGVADHAHLLVGLNATHCLADVLRDVKRASSKWVHDNVPGLSAFAWQEGYGAFTVGATDREAVRVYIGRQAEHHRVKTFREEYVGFLKRSGVEYDERFLPG